MFRTNFWQLLSEKERREKTRYSNVSEMSDGIGISRVTFYKYANDEMSSVDASTIQSFMEFLGVDDLSRFLVVVNEKQMEAQEAEAVSTAGVVMA